MTSSLSDTVDSVIGISLDDLTRIEPFKTTFHSVFFVIFLLFVGSFLFMIFTAFLYTLCDCCCSCCDQRGRKNKVAAAKSENDMQMVGRRKR